MRLLPLINNSDLQILYRGFLKLNNSAHSGANISFILLQQYDRPSFKCHGAAGAERGPLWTLQRPVTAVSKAVPVLAKAETFPQVRG